MISNRNLLAVPKEDFDKLTLEFEENIERVEIENTEHLNNFNLGPGLTFHKSAPRSQYIELVNTHKIYLSRLMNKLMDAEPIDHPLTGEPVDPTPAVDTIILYEELSRDRDKQPIFGYKDKRTNKLYGVVSKHHVYVPDHEIYKIMEAHVKDIEHEATYYHNIFQFKVDYRFPDIGFELEDDNQMQLMITVGGSAFGFRTAYVCSSAWEQACTNGMMAWVPKLSWKQIHVGMAPELLLTRYKENFNQCLAEGTKLMDLLTQANKVSDTIIDAYANVVEQLRSKRFNLLKREAEDIYRRIREQPRYQTLTAFNVGRAIAEQARDTLDLNRRIELEQLAGQVMLQQVKV